MINAEILKKIKTGAKVGFGKKSRRGQRASERFRGLVISGSTATSPAALLSSGCSQEVGVESFPINAMTISKVEILSSPKSPSLQVLFRPQALQQEG